MTVNGLEKRCVEEFIEKHQKSEAFFVKKWNECSNRIATTNDEDTRRWSKDHKEEWRKGFVNERHVIEEFALLIGKRIKRVDIRVKTEKSTLGELLEVRSVEIV